MKHILIMLLVLAAPGAFAERLVLNSNGHVGYINVIVNGATCTGDIYWHTSNAGANLETRAELVNCVVTEGYKTLRIEFDRSDRPGNQHYIGWYSEKKQSIAGHFSDGIYQLPWFAFVFSS